MKTKTLLGLGLIGFGVYYFVKHKKADEDAALSMDDTAPAGLVVQPDQSMTTTVQSILLTSAAPGSDTSARDQVIYNWVPQMKKCDQDMFYKQWPGMSEADKQGIYTWIVGGGKPYIVNGQNFWDYWRVKYGINVGSC